ncbi:uncharacterized protein SAMN05216303_102589 [Rhodoferax sp. OV413]|uniref:YecA/YgfB family protein n=1 Tax=Rhodoferax sp. OV413 TaxID=1855285 RepID=UPI00088A6EA6|nr:YecA family protein [Rhodoferax sp. OV413]SDO87732.1 uncharacterized protein SAMN05216303_102589 [Rhodoferax sp. OV413]
MTSTPNSAPLQPEDFDALDLILEDLRTRYDETPQWEFCEGFMAALVCGRKVIAPSEYFSVLLDIGDEGEGSFADEAQKEAFMALWTRRWNEVATALDEKDVKNLSDEKAYTPEVLDVRAMMLSLTPEERAEAMVDDEDGPLPSFGQVWALGFMFAVEAWPEEWEAPAKDKEAVQWLDGALSAIVALTEDDTGPAEISAFGPDEEGGEEPPPSMSNARMEAFGEAMWAVYDLRELWRSLGPRVETVRVEATPGRNDPCPCGSGKKYKKCHGMT